MASRLAVFFSRLLAECVSACGVLVGQDLGQRADGAFAYRRAA
jgi:hypothetical protein